MELILVRHGISEANKDRTIHQTISDHVIPLAPEGFVQAKEAATKVQQYLQGEYEHDCYKSCPGHEPHHKVRMWVSPYLRTRQTANAFDFLEWKDKCPILLDRREDIALCEQQFGLFDGLPDDQLAEKFPAEYAYYDKCEKSHGKFWARMPLGESRFDVTLRVHQAFGTWQRDMEKHGVNTLIVVSHGVTIRAIVMRWLHLPFEWMEQEPNPPNCSVRIINCGKDLGYI